MVHHAGRKHQIGLHCKQLGTPIIGDSKHGTTRSGAQVRLLESLEPSVRAAVRGRLQLHARSITICRGSMQRAAKSIVHVDAPVPEHFKQLMVAQRFTFAE